MDSTQDCFVAGEILETLAGDARQATDCKLTIFQDDATYNWFVKVGSKTYWGGSVAEALWKALGDIE